MGEPIHVISQVSFAIMKMQVPIIWKELILKNTELPNAAAELKRR